MMILSRNGPFLLLHFSRQKEKQADEEKLDALKAEIRRLKKENQTPSEKPEE